MADDTISVPLPEALRTHVRERVAHGSFSGPSDYVLALIRADMERQAEDELEGLLMDGIRSGPATPFSRADWDEIDRKLEEYIAGHQRRQPA